MELLEVNHLCKTYGSGETAVHALKDVSFSVPKGEYVAVVGESGSGKSTLLNLIGGLDTPTSGKVLIDGKDVFAMKDRELTIFRRRNIGFIFQAFNLIPELTVEQNILFPVLLDYQKPDRAYLEELLTVLNLKDRRKHLPSQLSGGQQQRVAIGRALMTRPSLILADEPTGNLDTQNTSEVIALLKETSRKYEQTILMITHNRSIAQTADRVLSLIHILKIEAHFRRRQEKTEAGKMISGDIVFIAGEMKVLIKSREISLTKTELKMLTFFLHNPKQILQKHKYWKMCLIWKGILWMKIQSLSISEDSVDRKSVV